MTATVRDLAQKLAGLPHTLLHERLRAAVAALTLAERFELLHLLEVYRHPESASGAASTLRETARLRDALPALVEAEGVRRVLDIPCGDFHWMEHVALDVEYIGADIVPEIVERNQERHGGERRRFVLLDATRDPLPRVDLILCRDLLVHLSLEHIRAALSNLAASGSRLLLTSHFGDRGANPDIVSGDFRPVNLCRAPFHLPPPRRIVSEDSELGGGAFRDRAMALWRLDDVGHRLRR